MKIQDFMSESESFSCTIREFLLDNSLEKFEVVSSTQGTIGLRFGNLVCWRSKALADKDVEYFNLNWESLRLYECTGENGSRFLVVGRPSGSELTVCETVTVSQTVKA